MNLDVRCDGCDLGVRYDRCDLSCDLRDVI